MFNLQQAPQSVVEASKGGRQWSIHALSEGDTPELLIMDYIGADGLGGGIAEADVVSFLGDHRNQTVKARINSFGGSVFSGMVMHNAFKEHGQVNAIVDGVAASAAAIAAMGAAKLSMHKASQLGIHRAWTVAVGNVKAMESTIEWLEAIDKHQISMYMEKTGASMGQVAQWLAGTSDGTEFSAEEAYEIGFADEIIGYEPKPSESIQSTSNVRKIAHMRQVQANARLRMMAKR